ncbi:MAG TPA: NAD(P)/FAD-dependent oxidoreductase [Rhizomicrobium sp.]|nr:NAD(P)/FAD-dependent oxidoreductase [Rhizomicrobium sp.]
MRIGIVGCGVAGQASAIALARAGHDITIFERFETARPVGAGLLLQPSGLSAMARLGLRDQAEHWGARVFELDGRIASGRRVLDLTYGNGDCGLGIHRGALFQVLHDALLESGARVMLNFEVVAIEGFAAPVVVSRKGKREGPFDLLIDCAGAHDGLRDTLGLRVHAPVYPWGAYWTTCPDRTGEFEGKLRQMYERAHTMMGVLPLGRVPGGANELPLVAFFWSLRLDDQTAQRAAGLEELTARATKVWPAAAPIIGEIARFEDLSFAIYRDVRLADWRRDRVLVIGDAAHGTSPQLGQGANLSLIDAVMLAHHLSRERDVDTALVQFCRARRPHIRFYRWASRLLTPAFQSDSIAAPWLRDRFLRYANLLPGGRYLTRTTLSGVRKFPFGTWTPPD